MARNRVLAEAAPEHTFAELLRKTTALATSWAVAIRPVGLSASAVLNSSGSFSSMDRQMPPAK